MTDESRLSEAICLVCGASREVIRKRGEDLRFGWIDASIGDKVWFVRSGENVLELLHGDVIGVKRYDRRMWENPVTGDSRKYTVSTSVTFVVETPEGIIEIDGKSVYLDKTEALLASIGNILDNYESSGL